MKPRSVILDLFGDYLRYGGSEVKAGDLVTLLGVFGIEEATVRMTLSRLRKEGWFTTRRLGRETVYALSDHMLEVLDEGRERIFAPYDEPWDRTWTTIIHQSETPDRLTRDRLRRELSWQGFGQLTPSTWLTPRGRQHRLRSLVESFPSVTFTVMRSQTAAPANDLELIDRCWDLPRIDAQYRGFLTAHGRLAGSTDGMTGAQALVERTTLIAAYRHFPFSDPWLPAELRPEGWPGTEANNLFTSAHRALGPAAEALVTSVIGRPLDTPLA
jgi:phenylacetic acid degradation operon negative regulatory protein